MKLSLLVFAVLVLHINAQCRTINFNGQISGLVEKSKVYISSLSTNALIDSAIVANTNFAFRLNVTYTDLFFIKFTSNKGEFGFAVLIDQNDFRLEVSKDFRSTLFSGSKLAIEQTDFYQGYHSLLFKEQDDILNVNNADEGIKIKTIDSIRGNYKTRVLDYCSRWVEAKPSSPFSLTVMYLYLNDAPPQLLTRLYDLLSEDAKTNNSVHDFIPTMIAEANINHHFKIGSPAQDFRLKDTSGKDVQFSHLLSKKLIVLDFWASWCAPCRRNNPEIKRIIEEFGDERVSFISISADDSKRLWVDAIEKDEMTWTQLSDLKGPTGGFIGEKGVYAFPTYVLMSREGVVISRPVNFQSLKRQIADLLTKL